jgi:hypothetical protein
VYTSFAYGLWIQSELPLLDPLDPIHEPDVTVYFGSLAEVFVEPNQGNEILVSLPWGLTLLIRGGHEVIVDVPPGVDLAVVRAHVLGAAMACVLRQRGYLVLHASCVAQRNQAIEQNPRSAIAFLGGSGWGKSTLASLFHQHGYSLLTDDVMALQMNGLKEPSPLVVPSFPEVKLLPDAAAAVGVASESSSMLQSLSDKSIQRLDQHFATDAIPLKHLYILRVGDDYDISPTPSRLAFTELIQHSRATKTMADQAFMVQHFHQCSALVKAVPISYLQRPRSLDQLHTLVKLIEAHLQPYSKAEGG